MRQDACHGSNRPAHQSRMDSIAIALGADESSVPSECDIRSDPTLRMRHEKQRVRCGIAMSVGSQREEP